jgi:hypothetical protein
MFRLERPSMAINDCRASDQDGRLRQFRLETNWIVGPADTRASILTRVVAVARSAAGGRLKNLVLSGHGSPGHLAVGEGFSTDHVSLFAQWRGLVEKIWLPDCRVAAVAIPADRATGGRNGQVFCSRIARFAACYVVASTDTQLDLPGCAPADMMTSFEGLVQSFGPNGAITWQHRYPSTYNP